MIRRWSGLRLGRRAVRIWRWAVRRRLGERYLRLNPAPQDSPPRRRCNPVAITKKLFDWGRRCLTRRPTLRGGENHAATDWDGGAVPLLERDQGGSKPPKGHLVVYVGDWKEGGARPYVVPLIYFHHPLFGELLQEAEEEFGYHHPGGITIPCPVARFERVQTRIAAAAAAGSPPAGRPPPGRKFSLKAHHHPSSFGHHV